jgi:hypothetical protein
VAGCGVFTVRQGTSGYNNNDFAVSTAVLPVTAGDYFELRVTSTTSNWDDIRASTRTWFAIEVVETADAANPPYDFSWPSPNCCFFAYFNVSKEKDIKRSPNGMKPSGT